MVVDVVHHEVRDVRGSVLRNDRVGFGFVDDDDLAPGLTALAGLSDRFGLGGSSLGRRRRWCRSWCGGYRLRGFGGLRRLGGFGRLGGLRRRSGGRRLRASRQQRGAEPGAHDRGVAKERAARHGRRWATTDLGVIHLVVLLSTS